ncbi:UAA transporter family/Triose-phosphate Transporter family [Novymonas esmeraldas]|uniref:UAA transporter family/Triose-phosphate Transporter family n=1 Tax=Novymonas esmeraldas TaxID=1808958 RepID=A0AAW0EXS6_9TRYP
MADVAVGLASIFCGCQANVFLLELIITRSPNTYYVLTCAQYVCVALFTLPLLVRFTRPRERLAATAAVWPLRWRRSRIALRHKLVLCIAAWLMSVGNNIAFGFHISVPLHATFRSSSLMLNMLAGYLFLGKRFTALQVASATTICVGLVALALEKARKTGGGGEVDASVTQWYWACGVAILVATTACTTALGVFQEHMYRSARAQEAASADVDDDDAPPMWAEALCSSHLFALPLFLLQPARLYTELTRISSGGELTFALNCVMQVVCVAGVYVMNNKTSAFTLTLTLTLRKLASFAVSVVYFGHYRHLTPVEWVAMLGALAAGTVYPLLPKAPHHASDDDAAAAAAAAAAAKAKRLE